MAVWPTHREKAAAQRRRKAYLRKQARKLAKSRAQQKQPQGPLT